MSDSICETERNNEKWPPCQPLDIDYNKANVFQCNSQHNDCGDNQHISIENMGHCKVNCQTNNTVTLERDGEEDMQVPMIRNSNSKLGSGPCFRQRCRVDHEGNDILASSYRNESEERYMAEVEASGGARPKDHNLYPMFNGMHVHGEHRDALNNDICGANEGYSGDERNIQSVDAITTVEGNEIVNGNSLIDTPTIVIVHQSEEGNTHEQTSLEAMDACGHETKYDKTSSEEEECNGCDPRHKLNSTNTLLSSEQDNPHHGILTHVPLERVYWRNCRQTHSSTDSSSEVETKLAKTIDNIATTRLFVTTHQTLGDSQPSESDSVFSDRSQETNLKNINCNYDPLGEVDLTNITSLHGQLDQNGNCVINRSSTSGENELLECISRHYDEGQGVTAYSRKLVGKSKVTDTGSVEEREKPSYLPHFSMLGLRDTSSTTSDPVRGAPKPCPTKRKHRCPANDVLPVLYLRSSDEGYLGGGITKEDLCIQESNSSDYYPENVGHTCDEDAEAKQMSSLDLKSDENKCVKSEDSECTANASDDFHALPYQANDEHSLEPLDTGVIVIDVDLAALSAEEGGQGGIKGRIYQNGTFGLIYNTVCSDKNIQNSISYII